KSPPPLRGRVGWGDWRASARTRISPLTRCKRTGPHPTLPLKGGGLDGAGGEVVPMAAEMRSAIDGAQRQAARRFRRSRWGLVGPALVLIGVFGVVPLAIMLIYSFLVAGTYGGVEWKFTTEAYVSFLFQRDLFDDSLLQFVPDYLQIYFRSLWL